MLMSLDPCTCTCTCRESLLGSKPCSMCHGTDKPTFKCVGCKQTRYCGRICQTAHWTEHKAECRMVRVSVSVSESRWMCWT